MNIRNKFCFSIFIKVVLKQVLYIHILEIHYKKRFPHHLKLNSKTLKH